MALSSQQKRVALQVVLGIVIIVLAYVLYLSITGPYEDVLARERITERTRDRMELTRTGLIRYREENRRFPRTLDSLAMFVSQNQQLRTELDSLSDTENFTPDSLIQSPRSGQRFNYEVSSDSARVDIYLLEDPDDTNNYIGSSELDVTMVNAASWE